jgi:hypothetical protein
MGGMRLVVRDFGLKLRVTILALGFTTQKELHRHFLEIAPTSGLEQDTLYKWLQGRSTPRSGWVYDAWAAMLRLDRPLAHLKSCSIDEFVEDLIEPYGLDRAIVATVIGRPAAEDKATDDASDRWRDQLCGTFACYSHAFSPIFRGKIMRGALTIAAPGPAAPLDVSYVETTPFTELSHRGRLSWSNRLVGLDLHDEQKGSHVHMTLYCPSPPASVLTGLMMSPSFHDPTPQPTVSRVAAIRVPTVDLEALGGRDCVFDPGEHSISAELALMGMRIYPSADLDRLLTDFLQDSDGGGFDQVSVDQSARLNFAVDRQLAAAAAKQGKAGAVPAARPVVLPFRHK